jgi:DNA-binding transcriptional LysR family regulator
MDLIAALRTFLRVAEAGSFSAVAAERGVTQPAVSRQVTALEEHFGTRLVQRSTHAVTLTEEGRDLVPAAQQLIDSADALQESTGRRRGKAVGRVRLSVPVPLGLYFSSRLDSLLEQHEELSIDLILHDTLRNLIEEAIDLQICVGPVSDSALISRRIGATTAFLVAAPGYLKAVLHPGSRPICSGTTALSTTAGDGTTSGGSRLPTALCLCRCTAGFAPTTPRPFATPHSTAAASRCCRISSSPRTSRRAGCVS